MMTIIVPTPSGADGVFRKDQLFLIMDEDGRALAKNPSIIHLS
jgi:hypothetical protein